MLKRLAELRKQKTNSIRTVDEIDKDNIPKHIAIIMDGNGRWAKKRGLPRIAGHREGMNVVRKIVKHANHLGVEVLTLYAFSTENWKRPKGEVDFLMRLPELFLNKELPELIKENVKVRLTGTKENLPIHTLRAIDKAIKDTEDNNGLILNFALNYGSRSEIIEAVKKLYSTIDNEGTSIDDITEESLAKYLMTSELDDPDLLIRTSGEIRLSNFMLWQLAYTEFWFTEVLWPDFSEESLEEAIRVYQNRARRYGGL
ncbi:isoprenyl transferase [Evansella cellulosilytica]|uniref:Isoprenyl transferase n=1 Tax=Evansella cellulosilytica (strain ATCC 21833 / DSM 2522 / FERM P-1141 / JCM 9156 / N-4) TaxID=649639 RepID=E6TST1_EVAC2|nr:isoprenyl transferase [Evansella cellulosilytica]ADU30723.1 undecaprenyl diphosphate synthase [Evansella cellulosilytica DSM 2522]